ncbi:MAG: hypothetical protein Q8O89_01485 [Nanoarchaeota archaeon]|nr:hypothetical protein [Nanoarchaeota archaeon]
MGIEHFHREDIDYFKQKLDYICNKNEMYHVSENPLKQMGLVGVIAGDFDYCEKTEIKIFNKLPHKIVRHHVGPVYSGKDPLHYHVISEKPEDLFFEAIVDEKDYGNLPKKAKFGLAMIRSSWEYPSEYLLGGNIRIFGYFETIQTSEGVAKKPLKKKYGVYGRTGNWKKDVTEIKMF